MTHYTTLTRSADLLMFRHVDEAQSSAGRMIPVEYAVSVTFSADEYEPSAAAYVDDWLAEHLQHRDIDEAIPHYNGVRWLADYLLAVMLSQTPDAVSVAVSSGGFTFTASV